MKNKTKTYILLATVLAVWGTIAYKFVNGLSPDVSEIARQDFDVSFKPKTNIKSDTFSIKNVERDPFLGTLASNKKRNTSSVNTTTKAIGNSLRITYGGIIKKQNSSDQVFVININDNQYLLRKGQVADSVKLVKGNTKEIVVRYKNKSQTIKRQ